MSSQVQSPSDTTRRMVLGFRATCLLLYVAAELGLADLLADGPCGSAERLSHLNPCAYRTCEQN